MISVAGAADVRRNGLGWYLYGVVAADDSPELSTRTAVDPEYEVELVPQGSLAGVASRVSLQEFDEETLPERLGDAAWLEQKIRAHEQVLEGVLQDASVVPCRFCTVYRSESELRRFLSERRDPLGAALDRVRGQVEVGVKAFVHHERFAAATARQNDAIRTVAEQVEAAEGGRAYLERRRLEQLVASELEEFRSKAGREIHSRLLDGAEDGLPLSTQAPEISGRDAEMLFNAAYLVSADRSEFEAVLRAVADEYHDSGIGFELTGPWPPYHFVPSELSAS